MKAKNKQNHTEKQPFLRSGYTLTEMLVAIAIVGILASILIPTLAKARMRARQTVCMNNLKQLGVAFISYGHDHGETVPYNKQAGNSGWVGLMKSYGITDKLLHCPMCDENNEHSLGGMRKNWRVGSIPGEEEVAEDIITISNSFNVAAQIIGRVEAFEGKQLTIDSKFGTFIY